MSWQRLFSTPLIDSYQQLLGQSSQKALSDAEFAGYMPWLELHHAHILSAPMGERHLRLWEWFESLTPGIKPDARVEIWPRGGAKSSTAELGVAYVGSKLSRRYCLYVSETQDQADKHVAAIASAMEREGVERSLNKYGNSRGWRRNQLRCANGFNVEALGLDTAARGIKLDEFRPGLIIFDDIDNQNDSPKVTEKKERSIKTSVIPAGSTDCAVLFIQNMIMEDGIVAKLYDGRADFLLKRDVPPFEPAAVGLEIERMEDPDRKGRMIYAVKSGMPTWEGQNLKTIEAQINEWGLDAFLRESQHEVHGADGVFFDISALRRTDPEARPRMASLCRAWDFAATQDGGDYSVGSLVGLDEHEVTYFHDVVRGQWGTDLVWKKVFQTARDDREKYGAVVVCIPIDPGSAGKSWAYKLAAELRKEGFTVILLPTQGKKAVRVKPLQKEFNQGNVVVPKDAPWLPDWEQEFRRFREDEEHAYDDQVDSGGDAYKGACKPAFHIGGL